MAELRVNGDEIDGVATSCNIAAAVMLDVGIFWVFFSTPEPDDEYLVFVQSPGYVSDVTHREAEFFEIAVTERGTGSQATPDRLSISVQRVK